MVQTNRNPARRQFLGTALPALTAPFLLPGALRGASVAAAPGERITLGFVGIGQRGLAVMKTFLADSGAQVVAVCDVQDRHYREREWGKEPALGREAGREVVEQFYSEQTGSPWKGCAMYADYRELCARDDLDAVVVSTPDHWHALCALEALGSGKDVYCEKPVTHHFAEGQALYREVAIQSAVFQVGSQQRSEPVFRTAVELVRNGHLGKIRRVEVGLPRGETAAMGDAAITEPPEGLDYDAWCGPSPVLPYMRARHHRWWRWNRAYGGGNLMDWIGHHHDIAQWSLDMDRSGPETVRAEGWTWASFEGYDTPVHYEVAMGYPGEIEVIISSSSAFEAGTKWIGEDGWLFATRGRIEASNRDWIRDGFDPGPWKAYLSPGHERDFLDAVRERRDPVAPAETGHRSVTPGHLGYVAAAVGRALRWDAANEMCQGDETAQQLLMALPYRDGWSLEGGRP